MSEGLARPAGALLATGAGPGAAREAGLPLWAGPGAVPSSGLVGLGGDSPKLPGLAWLPCLLGARGRSLRGLRLSEHARPCWLPVVAFPWGTWWPGAKAWAP